MSLSQVKDQDNALRLLRNIKRLNRIPSGLLFWGPDGVGKRLTAVEFAKAVNCRESADDACDACLACRKCDHGNHADIMTITPSGRQREIKVETIEQVIETAFYRPFEGGRRIIIFQDADRINEPAQNHFLKTLEEPPSQSIFILLTERPRRLLPTIRSRCQRVCFGLLHQQTVADMLLKHTDLGREDAQTLAALSQGSMARALELVNTDRHKVVLDIIHRLAIGEDPLIVSDGFAGHIQTVEKAIAAMVQSDNGKNGDNPDEGMDNKPDKDEKEEREALVIGLVRRELIEYLRLFDAWYRDELLYGVTKDTRIVYNIDHLHQMPKDIDTERHMAKLAAIVEARKYIERNLQAKRVFRDLFFALA